VNGAAAAGSSGATGATGVWRWLEHPWLTTRVQIALGVIFMAAALPKIVDPPSFVHMIHNYELLPPLLVRVSALVMPWLELLVGLALALGIWRRTATLVTVGLLVLFIGAISVNLARGNAIDCGCFDVSAANLTKEERLADMRFVIYRDVAMLAMAGQILRALRKDETA